MQCLKQELEQPYMNFWLNKLLAQLVEDRNSYPVAPPEFSTPAFSGFLLNYIRRRLARSDAQFIYSLQRGCKLAWPEPPECVEQSRLEEHRSCFSKEPSPLWDENIVQEIRSTSRDVFGQIKPSSATRFLPSMSACFEKNRSSGGASALFKKLELKFDPKWGKLPQLHSQLEIHRISEFRRIEDSLLADVNLDAKVVSIAEPGGKYRILSKGSGYLYSYVQPIQGALLSSWKGRAESTMRDQDLTDHVSTIWRNRYPDFQLLASVD
jgi:hypothetical protein